KLAVTGVQEMSRFCQEYGVDHEICGKIVLATDDAEVERLRELQRRGEANGLEGIEWLEKEQIAEREPHAKGKAALLVPQEGIVDFAGVVQQLKRLLLESDAEIITATEVRKIRKENGKQIVEWDGGSCSSDYVVNCGGLHSDRVARAAGLNPNCLIVPFRGEYFTMSEKGERLVNHLIYPTPNPALPNLGVHFTRMIHGGIEAGPNAVLAMKREGYRKTDFSFRDVFESLGYIGFYRFLMRYPGASVREIANSAFKSIFLKNLQHLIPEIQADDLSKAGGAGVRAQAIDRDGKPVFDFAFEETEGQLHVLNAPSPAATASLVIGQHLATRVLTGLSL
ncbi:MAG: L-2-hydroxyglutarate oxidase, partial [Victivallales bacterium]|nr:L-2-hydroxyglutarate oxidase [Victivallales bacterium]